MRSSFDYMIRFFFYAGTIGVMFFFLYSLHLFGFNEQVSAGSSEVWVKKGDQRFTCVAARTPQEQQQGLSGRASLIPYDCMLFFMPSTKRYGFWMKDMKFSIDIIWILDGKVVDISEGLPLPTTKPLPTYKPRIPVNVVMEVPSGFVKEKNIRVGDGLEIVSQENKGVL